MKYIGAKYNKLTIIRYIGRNKQRKAIVECLCECGNKVSKLLTNVKSGHGKSCGCIQSNKRQYIHTSEYNAWQAMKARCSNPNVKFFYHYGGRGITVCDRWLLFDNFIADMGPRPTAKHSLDRIDNNGNYSKENCRWATRHQQQSNRRNSKLLTYEGITMTEIQWCRKLNLKGNRAITRRLKAGWPEKKAFTVPKMSDIREYINKSHKFKKPQ